MSKLRKAVMQAAAGNAGEVVYVDDVFSTYLYDGNGSSQTITNGIDLDGEGGLVWIKGRTQNIATQDHRLVDTARGVNQAVSSSTNDNVLNITGEFTSFNSDGFTLASTSGNGLNRSGEEYCSWTFRNQPGFFQVLTYEGNGTAGRTVSHSLGSVPGCIIVKAAESGVGFNGDWAVYHRGNTAAPETDRLILNSYAATADSNSFWNDTAPTATEFTLGASNDVNGNGVTYVAYLFAHDAQDFGTDSDEAIIKCESISHTSGTYHEVDLGFEPQFILYKCSSSVSNWEIFDSMRGLENAESSTTHPYLNPVESSAESFAGSQGRYKKVTPTGFITREAKTATFIYIAIRRPHKPAEEFAATDLFEMDYDGGAILNNSAKDFMFNKNVTASVYFEWGSRIQGTNCLNSGSNGTEFSAPELVWSNKVLSSDGDGRNYYMFRRAPGFLDVVAYTGGQSAGSAVNHNLGVVPEMMIVKNRDNTGSWVTKHSGLTGGMSGDYYCYINSTSAEDDGGANFRFNPSATQFTLSSTNSQINNSTAPSNDYIAYLFATVPGISKVGSYSGTGTNQNIDCGFSSGARFVAIKRIDSSGPWEIYSTDIFKGINAGAADQHNFWNTNTRVYTEDNLDPYSGGFRVNGSASADVNASGGTYIFLAIA